ncbi:MAG: aspartate dehydrogenase [Aurantimonas endophytica]|uniref:aspartate dehydrogenase n=1 Tax=Aurantimonas endophytica TaxID=1522175 RepID=UPI0030019578
MSGKTPTDSTERHVGLIGYGAAGRACAALLLADPRYRLTVLTRSPPEEPLPDRLSVVASLDALIAACPQIIVEAASAEAFASLLPACLRAGVDVVAASIGALQSQETGDAVVAACREGHSRLVLPSGAVGGLDYIAAAALAGDIAVIYTSRKPPAAWTTELAEAGLGEAARSEPVTLFEGSAPEAARLYPRNLNAGLTVALAAGIDRTRVRVVADPSVSTNTHEIEVTSAAGDAYLRFANKPSPDNPKTSMITALSLASAVQKRLDPMQ